MKSILTAIIASVWLINGLYAKLLGFVPRHEEIVCRILDTEYCGLLTRLIGVSEIGVAIWIMVALYRRQTAAAQIGIILTMNVLETILAPDLLLWGRLNLLFAVLFCGLVYFHGYRLKDQHGTT
jgi:hypothetical protein